MKCFFNKNFRTVFRTEAGSVVWKFDCLSIYKNNVEWSVFLIRTLEQYPGLEPAVVLSVVWKFDCLSISKNNVEQSVFLTKTLEQFSGLKVALLPSVVWKFDRLSVYK